MATPDGKKEMKKKSSQKFHQMAEAVSLFSNLAHERSYEQVFGRTRVKS